MLEMIGPTIVLFLIGWLGYEIGYRKGESITIAEIFPSETRIYLTEKGRIYRP